jgi:excisionase family DNA binding protein
MPRSDPDLRLRALISLIGSSDLLSRNPAIADQRVNGAHARRQPDVGQSTAHRRQDNDTPWLTLKEACDYARLSDSQIRRYVKSGQLPAYSVGHGWRFNCADIDEFLLSSPGSVRKGPSRPNLLLPEPKSG